MAQRQRHERAGCRGGLPSSPERPWISASCIGGRMSGAGCPATTHTPRTPAPSSLISAPSNPLQITDAHVQAHTRTRTHAQTHGHKHRRAYALAHTSVPAQRTAWRSARSMARHSARVYLHERGKAAWRKGGSDRLPSRSELRWQWSFRPSGSLRDTRAKKSATCSLARVRRGCDGVRTPLGA